MKILSPVGNFESLKAAIASGADEVYLGINNFNARNNIDGFTLDTLKDAVKYAHLHNVKVNLAINILFNDDELQEAMNTIVDAYNMGVDYFIVQDLGLASLISKHYPQIEMHASTQMGIHNLEGVKAIEKYGFKRIVLARETPLEEIKRIKQNTTIELEYFAQGALCVSFSGNCYLSSYLYNASGNRGKCKQLCRLPYTLEYKNKTLASGYLLSAKDFCMIEELDNLKNAGIDVIKIEGRARRPFYVAASTKQYYNALHNLPYNKESLKLAFNREYTDGYFSGNGNIISRYNNHIGLHIGKIKSVNSGKRFNEVIITSKIELSPKSTFKIFKNNLEVATLSAFDLTKTAKNTYRITTTQKLERGCDIHLIIDAEQEDNVLKLNKKRMLNIELSLKENEPICANLTINEKTVKITGPILEKANRQPLSKEIISQNFAKSELFEPNITYNSIENVFLTNKYLNEFRRKVYDTAFEELTSCNRKHLTPIKIKTKQPLSKFVNFQIVEDITENLVQENIIYSPSHFDTANILEFKTKCEGLGKNGFLDTPNFALHEDIILLKNIIKESKLPIITNNYYALTFDTKKVIGAGLNIYNSIAANQFDYPILTAESNISSQIDFPYMTLRHCPFKNHLNSNCSNCPYKIGYYYKMENGKILHLKRKKLTSCTFYLTKE